MKHLKKKKSDILLIHKGEIFAKSIVYIQIICFKKTRQFNFNTWLKLLELEKQTKKELNLK